MASAPVTLPLVAIVGPTASGKSSLAVWLAERLGGEVVACDSTQLYRGFDIGTAKPTAEERRGIPHHLLDVLDPHEPATAGDYRSRAIEVLNNLRARVRLPVFTAGTGLYLRALLEGLADAPPRSEAIRERLRETSDSRPPGYMHRILWRLDRESAVRIDSADEQKLIRAIEVCLLSRRPLSQVYREGRTPLEGWTPVKVGLSPAREALLARINRRVDAMLAAGWLDEVRALLAGGAPDTAKPFDFIGYRELRACLKGELKMEDCRAAIAQVTRRYAKRQMTWFRKEAAVEWFAGFGDDPAVQSAILKSLGSRGVSCRA